MSRRYLIWLFLIILVINWNNGMAQSLSSQEIFEKHRANLQLRGNIYGLPDEHASLVFEESVPDSIKIDTLSKGSTLNVFQDGELYLKIDSASHYSFNVDIGHEYRLEYTHPNYVTKVLDIDATTIPFYEDNMVMTMDISMFSPNVARALDEPLCIVSYNKMIQNLDWDKALFEKQVSKMLKVE